MGACDGNPLNRSFLASSDEANTMKMLVLRIVFVVFATMLDQLSSIQAGLMTVAMGGVVYYHFDGVSGPVPGSLAGNHTAPAGISGYMSARVCCVVELVSCCTRVSWPDQCLENVSMHL
jgi:hypothetical protein